MHVSDQQFDQLMQENRLVLSLLGMSNMGKTYWSDKLGAVGFKQINCDDLIEAQLSPMLKESGYAGIADVSRWMGQPYDERFSANQERYLSLEKEIMEVILTQITDGELPNTVIDTTGSVVHTSRDICTRLKQSSLIVYIEASAAMQEAMFSRYLAEPKPVVFGDIYRPQETETARQTLARCYRELLNLRSELYADFADIRIPREALREPMDGVQFIALVKNCL